MAKNSDGSSFYYFESQSPQAGQFNSYRISPIPGCVHFRSQSPQAGQFNSYGAMTNGGIWFCCLGLNPLKRVNSILTLMRPIIEVLLTSILSQSPQAGQFNSYGQDASKDKEFVGGLNPLKRVNSILTRLGSYFCFRPAS